MWFSLYFQEKQVESSNSNSSGKIFQHFMNDWGETGEKMGRKKVMCLLTTSLLNCKGNGYLLLSSPHHSHTWNTWKMVLE